MESRPSPLSLSHQFLISDSIPSLSKLRNSGWGSSGEDTRYTLADLLYDAFNQKGINAFKDDEKLEKGKTISPELSRAIEESQFAVVIFSKNYASSTWCLNELAKIFHCEEHMGMKILPVFYDVEPSDVQKQMGTFAQAFIEHENRFKENIKKVKMWRAALTHVGNLVGWPLINSLKQEDESSTEAKVAAGHVAANTIRLLIAGTQAGCLIGISGQNIEKLRDSCGAIITILAQNQLPLCASAHESDRVVQISGDVPAVLKALEEIGSQLRENPPRQVISISPVYNITSIRPPQPYLDPTSADYVTFEMMISESLVGGLIGRSGTNISRIRNESGAMIKVYGGKGETKHRQIQFGGSAQQVALAKLRVDEYIYSQLIQQPGAQQPALPL
ncbi:probable disease resistance protein At4g19530 [Quercus suber]|uniref:probable disease resistance protein At4g19530 n=1 Tax=Quercus suber TaxID=58331 RepID=UPI0032DFCE20